MLLPPSQALAVALADSLVRGGVTDVVVCPGSRSQSLALEFARRESAGEISVHVRIDEREGGFLALGLAKASGRPVAVVTTSGSAVANLLPATIEAHHALVPLLLLTADRPPELKGRGANQTTVQEQLLKPAVIQVLDTAAPIKSDAAALLGDGLGTRALKLATHAKNPGPVQINIGLREPLSATVTNAALAEVRDAVAGAEHEAGDTTGNAAVSVLDPVMLDAVPTLVLAGMPLGVDNWSSRRAAEVAEQLQAPLFAEIVSSAGSSPQAVHQFRMALVTERGKQLAAQLQQIVVFGKPSLYREVERLVRADGIRLVVVQPSGTEWYRPRDDAIRASDVIVSGTVPNPVSQWHDLVEAQRRVAPAGTKSMSRTLVTAVANATGDQDAVVFGASSLVRVAGNALQHGFNKVFASRGLAGIDGTISTAVGIATIHACGVAKHAAAGGGVKTAMARVIVGDITFLYGAAGLWRAAGEQLPQLQIVVGNDHGGSIFEGLEVAAADPALFARVMKTPQHAKLSALAAAYDWPYTLVRNKADLEVALAGGPGIIEVTLR